MYSEMISPDKKSLTTSRIKLMVSAALIAAGIVIGGLLASGTIPFESAGVPLLVLLIAMIVGGIIFFFVGYRSGIKRHGAPKAGRAFSILGVVLIVGAYVCFMVMVVVPMITYNIRNEELNSTLKKYVKDDWASEYVTAKVPDDPKFVLFDMDKKEFSYPNNRERELLDSPYAAKTPEEANIVIAFSKGRTGTYGYWADEKTGEKIVDAYSQSVRFYAIRLKDWSLIDDKEVTRRLGKNDSFADAREMVSIYDINYLIEHGHFKD